MRIGLFLLCIGMYAQTPPSVNTPSECVSEHVSVGGQYSNQSPHWTGWVGAAFLMGKPNPGPCTQTYNFDAVYVVPNKAGGVSNNYTAGVAQPFKKIGNVQLFVLGGAGPSVKSVTSSVASVTSAVTSTGLALNSGIFGSAPIGRGFTVDFMAQAMCVAGKGVVIGGLGLGWSK